MTSIPTAVVLALTLAAADSLASPAAAQGRSIEDTKTIDSYRLTMPVLRKVLPALYAPGAQSCPREKDRDPNSLSIAAMTRSLERCAPGMQALSRAGVPAWEAAIVFGSLLRTGQRVAMQAGKESALPLGVVRDNALLLEHNDPEIRKLTKPGAEA
ncbi:MAG TPA: hypothetical protein VFM14_05530 [Gemmatimonadales bacterium]|nr:hypothetical protein [Gemmatimonadales bacterium]